MTKTSLDQEHLNHLLQEVQHAEDMVERYILEYNNEMSWRSDYRGRAGAEFTIRHANLEGRARKYREDVYNHLCGYLFRNKDQIPAMLLSPNKILREVVQDICKNWI